MEIQNLTSSVTNMALTHTSHLVESHTTRKKKAEILEITDKIHNTLNTFDSLYDGGDELLSDVSSQVNELDNGPLKFQLKDFINQYKDMGQALHTVNEERTDLLESLADWFESQTLDSFSFNIDNNELDDYSINLQEGFATTKIGFEKLQKMNEDIAIAKEEGGEVDHLVQEREKLESSVMQQFKDFKELKKEKEMYSDIPQNNDFEMEKAWKLAAGEICGLLHKVRDEETDYIKVLEEKVEDLVKMMDKQTAEMHKQNNELRQLKFMEKKWKDDNLAVTEEKARITKLAKKLKKELKATRARLTKYEPLKRLIIDDTQDDDNVTENLFKEPDLRLTGGTQDPTILKARLKDCNNQLEKLKLDNEDLVEKIKYLEEEMEEQDDLILKLEQDKQELMRQMQQASVKPDTRRLSIAAEVKPKTEKRMSIIGKAISPQNGICACQQRTITPVISEDDLKPQLSELRIELDKKAEELKDKSLQCEGLQEKIKTLEDNMSLCSEQMDEMKRCIQELLDAQNKENEDDGALIDLQSDIQLVKSSYINGKRKNPIRTFMSNSRSTENDMDDFENITVEQEKKHDIDSQAVALSGEPPHAVIPIKESEISKQNKFMRRKKEGVMLVSNSMQTDPRMDPLGAWSQAIEKEKSWRPPMPPSKWIDYDPTPSKSEKDAHSKEKVIAEAMMRGAEPSDIKFQAKNCVKFVERELKRLVEGIQGFIEYTNYLVDRESKNMGQANKRLKGELNKEALVEIEDKLKDHIFHFKKKLKAVSKFKQSDDKNSEIPEESLKAHITGTGEEAIRILNIVHELLFGSLHTEFIQYELIHAAIQGSKHDGIFSASLAEGDDEANNQLVPKRSKSHNDLELLGKISIDSDKLLRSTRSIDDLREKKNKQDEDSSMGGWLKPKTVAKASVPKKGQIALVANAFGNSWLKTKTFDTVYRKVKPTPLSHQKLLKKQQQLMKKSASAKPSKPKHLTEYQLPPDYYEDYTFDKLESTTEKVVEKVKQKTHESTMKNLMKSRDKKDKSDMYKSDKQDIYFPPIQ